MLSYVEMLEADLKLSLSESFKKKEKRDSSGEPPKEGEKQEDDLAQITGGKEAEIEHYV